MKEKAFNFDICDASFSEKSYLNRHIEAVHEKNKPFKSNSCGASFARNTFESPCYFSSCRKEAFQMLH